jgi:hypothetical protein
MSPEEFLDYQAKQTTISMQGREPGVVYTAEEMEEGVYRPKIERFKKILGGEEHKPVKDIYGPHSKFPLFVLEYDKEGELTGFQEGRHRAVAAKELGMEKIPVLIAQKRFAMSPEKQIEAAIAHFGVTDDPYEAGFLLPNGLMLDFGSYRFGGRHGTRARDHSEISMAYEDYEGDISGMAEFVDDAGAISMGVFDNQANLRIGQVPTPQQMDIILDVAKGKDLYIDNIKKTDDGYSLIKSFESEATEPIRMAKIRGFLNEIQ